MNGLTSTVAVNSIASSFTVLRASGPLRGGGAGA